MPGIADKFTQSARGRLLWPGMTKLGVVDDALSALLADDRVEAVRATARAGEIKEDKAKQNRKIAVIQDWEKSPWRMAHEIGECHFTGSDERDRPRKQPQNQQNAADQFNRAGGAVQRKPFDLLEHRYGRPFEQFG